MAILGWRAAAALSAALCCSCGDALVDNAYRGTILFNFTGNVMGATDAVDSGEPIRIAVFWSSKGLRTMGTENLVEQPAAAQQAIIPFSFTLNLFDTPPAAQIYKPQEGGAFAIGQLFGYPDRNHNGQRDLDEPIVAASSSRALLYAPEALALEKSPTGLPVPAGYHLIFASIPCGPRPQMPPPAPTSGGCPASLGQPCSTDAQCAPGVCIRDFLAPWPLGGCGLSDPPPADCGSPQVARVAQPGPAPTPTYWVKSCTTDADCGRAFPYQCDLALGACLPTRSLLMQVGDPPMIAPWCR